MKTKTHRYGGCTVVGSGSIFRKWNYYRLELTPNKSHILLVLITTTYESWKWNVYRRSADLPGRERLRSANSFRYEIPKLKLKFDERGFSYAGPKTWNSLPSNLQELTNTDTFKKQLKTHLFKLAYDEYDFVDAPLVT